MFKIIATTNSSLKLHTLEKFPLGASMDVYKKLPQPSQSFIQKYIDEYKKGNQIVDVLVEYEGFWQIRERCTTGEFMGDKIKISKDNTITIRKVKKCWNRDEVIELCKSAFLTGTRIDDVTFDEWIEDNI